MMMLDYKGEKGRMSRIWEKTKSKPHERIDLLITENVNI